MSIFIKKVKTEPKNILISRTDRIGDFILTLPVFEAIKRIFNTKITVLCDELVSPILKENPFVDQVILVKKGLNDQELVKKIISYNFDTLLVLVNDPFILKILPKLKSIPIRIGPSSKLKAFINYTHPVIQKRSKSIMNEAEYNLEILEVFKLKIQKDIRPKIYFKQEEIEDFKQNQSSIFKNRIIKKIIFHAGMNGSALNISKDIYLKLLEKIIAENYLVILTGSSKEEMKLNEEFVSHFKDNPLIINLTGQLNLRELSILILLSDLFIGPSTGPTHIASAVETALISFYPPILVQSKTRWEPYLADSKIFTPDIKCDQKYKCKEKDCRSFYCMDGINPDDVFKQIKQILNNN